MTASGCGCPSRDPGATGTWTPPMKGGGCGCSGGGTSCGCGGGKSDGGSMQTCTSGTYEASKRPGVVTEGCVPRRARFFPGELVTDTDLTALVDYHRGQQLMSNGVIGGWGVYCGFSLCIDPDTCTVCVGSGIAVDALGRMIVNESTICIRRPDTSEVAGCDPCAKQPDATLYLAIVYDDCLEGAKPRYGSVCGTGPDPGCDFSRVHERGRLVWIRDIPDGYWTSGCLVDPCAEPPEKPRAECLPVSDKMRGAEPRLDECTPCIGIRGGEGVEVYARHLDAKWALSRNVSLLTEQKAICGVGVATLIDVISGVACEPCGGEAVVVLGRVRWGTSLKGSTVTVEPLRRRVLSNANLTYLVEWLMEQVLCGQRPSRHIQEKEPPSATAVCSDPCLDDKGLVEAIAEAAVGNESRLLGAAQARAAWWVTVKRVRTLADFHQGAFLDVVSAAFGSRAAEIESESLDRYRRLLGRVGSKAAIDVGIELLYPNGVPAEKRGEVEDAIYHFLHMEKIAALGTARAPAVVGLARTIHREILGLGDYPHEETVRLEKKLPGGIAGAGDVTVLQRQVMDLKARVEAQAEELKRVRGRGGEVSAPPAESGESSPADAPSSPAEERPAGRRRRPPPQGKE